MAVSIGAGPEAAAHGASGLGALDQARARQHVEMLHHRRQRDGERRRDLGHRQSLGARQPIEDGPPRRVGERREGLVELGIRIVNHVVKYCLACAALSSDEKRTSRAVEDRARAVWQCRRDWRRRGRSACTTIPNSQPSGSILRPLAPEHAAALYAIHADAETMRFWHDPPHPSVERTRAVIDGPHRRHRACVGAAASQMAATPSASSTIWATPVRRAWATSCIVAIGGKGSCRKRCEAALAYGFERLGLDRVELWIDARNVASQRLAERTGFKRRAAFRQKYLHDDDAPREAGLWTSHRGLAPGRSRNDPATHRGVQPAAGAGRARCARGGRVLPRQARLHDWLPVRRAADLCRLVARHVDGHGSEHPPGAK